MKHNKKRNTAFLFECLNRELTRAIVEQKKDKTLTIRKLFTDYFRKGSILAEELDCYRSILESRELDMYTAEKTLFQCKQKHLGLDPTRIFQEQSQMIKSINTQLGASVYNTFVPNYKTYATVAQIFGNKTSTHKRVLMEKAILEHMTSEIPQMKPLKAPDSLVVESFIKRFNEKYATLPTPQRSLLNKYITSFANNGVDFKTYLVEELSRLEEEVVASLLMSEVNSDTAMVESTNRVIEEIRSFDVSSVTPTDILQVLKIQQLVSEYHSHDDQD